MPRLLEQAAQCLLVDEVPSQGILQIEEPIPAH
jgi:hypothetical protein